MTNEQKAKAYDEALEDMRAIYPNLKGDAKLAVEHAFPELTESDDERIREEMIRYFTEMKKGGSASLPYDDCIAYLERRKETGIQWLKSDNVKNPDKPYIDKAGMFYTTDGKMCHASEIEKRKPAERSEEDEERLKAICTYLQDYPRLAKINDVKRFNEYCDWLKSLRPQPKNEWSEEDEKMRNNLVSLLVRLSASTRTDSTSPIYSYPREIDWLKSLRPSWKPSEQEKGALRTAIYVLREERNFPKAAGHLQAILDAFEGKESRKDWKPSEEQMKMLKYTIDYYGSHMSKELVSLYEELKKLI